MKNPPRSPAPCAHRLTLAAAAVVAGFAGSASAQTTPPSAGDRVLGLDVSAWQGNISQTTWNNIRNVENRRFVFIRSSRGGTTGYYDQSNADNNPPTNTLSQRYDDPYFVQNITRATAAGMYAGSYHFSRPDIIAGTLNANGIANNGTDEANHFIQMAGAWMRPGYLLPVHDLEAGETQRSPDELAQFAIDFSNRVYEVMGIRPAVYINGSYSDHVQQASPSLRNQLVAAYPTLWTARWPNQADPNSIPVQTSHPKDTVSYVYGPWDDAPNPTHPWDFWQYASTGRLQSFNNGGSNLDLSVAQGNIEYVKDHLVPALWVSSASGDWSTLANWNSGQTPVAPVQGPGQVARVGSLTLPATRLPGADDTVNLNRPNENVAVTLSANTHTIRRLNLSERLNVTGGTLNVSLSGFAYAGGTLSPSGGTVNIEQANFAAGSAVDFAGGGTLNVGSLILGTNVTFSGTAGTGVLGPKAGASPVINLGNATRSFNVADGSANVDLRVAIPFANGTLAKDGVGTLELTANNAGSAANVVVNNGYLLLSGNNQLGVNGVRTTQPGSNTVGGTVRLSGTNLNYAVPVVLGGTGFNNAGALENLSGNNTWSGTVTLNGAQNNQAQPGLNQVAAAAGTTLTLSGVIQNGAGASWAKLGDGDVVLGGTSANTYTNLTRVFAGRLILEKNAALGTAGAVDATGNTFQLPGATSTIAFRAPAGSPGLNYTTAEWIHTEGTGVGGLGQVDSLGGTNVFAGHLGLGGPEVAGLQQASIGVSAGSLEIQGGLYARSPSGGAPRGITKLGPGTLVLSGDSGVGPSNTSAGGLFGSTFNVNAGSVLLKGTAGNTANVPGVQRWNVNGASSRLSVGRTGATGGATVHLNAGTLHTDIAGVNVAGMVSFEPGGTGGTIDTGGAGASMTIAGSLGNAGGRPIVKTGLGTLNVTGPQLHGSGAVLDARAGTVNLHSVAGGDAGWTLNLRAGVPGPGGSTAAVNFHTPQRLVSLSIAPDSRVTAALGTGGAMNTVRTDSLAIDAGVLDLTGNDLILDYAGATSPVDTVLALVRGGYNLGDWQGDGIASSLAAADPRFALAVADNASLANRFGNGLTGPRFAGQSVDPTTVLVKLTHRADLDLDGVITSNDASIFNSHFIQGSPAYWAIGDVDYDGIFTTNDATIFNSYYDETLPNVRDLLQSMPAAPAFRALNVAAVPEPAAAGLLLLAAAGGLVSRRRRRA